MSRGSFVRAKSPDDTGFIDKKAVRYEVPIHTDRRGTYTEWKFKCKDLRNEESKKYQCVVGMSGLDIRWVFAGCHVVSVRTRRILEIN
ncbi:hypothetical protein MAR_031047 [Mya arenaria]|uniref:Uncharacterized protein n=1 Tax=Mya arenaria TaxID=6604 RepID=A0ABY7F2P6_MYAAR|nr:hypothetical protein MAR_031047 [Mya arenaria]